MYVRGAERAPRLHGNLQCVEVMRSYGDVLLVPRRVSSISVPADDLEGQIRNQLGWKTIDRRRRCDTGQGLDPLYKLLHALSVKLTGLRLFLGERGLERQHVAGFESRRSVYELPETGQQQGCAYEQNEGDCDFTDDQRSLCEMTAASNLSGVHPQRIVKLSASTFNGRNEAEEKCATKCQCDSKCQRGCANVQRGKVRKLERAQAHQRRSSHSRQENS